MKADAWHTLSDTLTSLIVIVGFWISARKPDDKHPFGHGRAELISAVIIGTLLSIVGFEFLRESISRLMLHQGVLFNATAIIIFLLSVLLKEAMASFSIWAGKKIESRALIADGWHHRSDAIASGVIVIGAFFGRYFWWIDGVAGIFVSFLIFYATYDILQQSISALLGEKPDDKFIDKLTHFILSAYPQVSNFHHLHVHKYGDLMEITFHLHFPMNMSIKEAHDITTAIEKSIRNEFKMEATIHIEPILVNQGTTNGN